MSDHDSHAVPQPIPLPDDFPIQWKDPFDIQYFWTRDRMSLPDQIPILEYEAFLSLDAGIRKSSEHFDIPETYWSRRINTYYYATTIPTARPDEMAANEAALEQTMRRAMAGLQDAWEGSYLPEIQAHLAFWSDFDLANASTAALADHLEESLRRFERVWELHFFTVIPMLMSMSLFEEMYVELFAPHDPFAAYELVAGLTNKTTESGLELWKLSRSVLTSVDVHAALSAGDTQAVLIALGGSEDGRALLTKLNAYLQVYGRRGDKWGLSTPSWIEDPTPVLNNLRDYLTQGDRDLSAEMDRSAARRDAAVTSALEQLNGYPEPVVQQFESLLWAAQYATVLSEDHGYWIDFSCLYQLRMVFTAIGRRLVIAGAIDVADDLFHLTLGEIRTALGTSATKLRSVIEERKAEMARWAKIVPPDALGTPPSSPPPDNPIGRTMGKFAGTPVEASTEPGVILGRAGSPGIATGRARIIRSISEAGVLEPGDVLVAETTAPSWTPLFGTVAAVVTDTGGILSHCAVVAREYGIPAVVGTGIASATILDGQMVEVDGDAGTVRIIVDRTSESVAV